MPIIRQLSQSLINKIAAGEVIERPASVVKELMENAADAGATRIDVSITAGGADMVRIVDNGCGIEPEQLPLAAAAHATSKLAEADDLFRVGTLGFRGEAIASISEISRMTLRSRTPDSAAGAELRIVGGELGEVTPCGCPVGTLVEVRDLFFNTPVRRKFLRTAPTELGHVTEAFTRIALPLPGVHFTLRHNERTIFDLPAVDRWVDRIAALFGRDLAECLIRVESQDEDIRLAGYVADPSQSRANAKMQYVFLNGRHIRDRSLQHALTEAYRGLLTTGRQPIAFLRLDMPPEMVDVNVHPTKLEVRFQNSGRHYSQLLSTLRTTFLKTDLSARVRSQSDSAGEDDSFVGGHDPVAASQHRQQLIDWAKGEVSSWKRQGVETTERRGRGGYGGGSGGGGGSYARSGEGGYGGGPGGGFDRVEDDAIVVDESLEMVRLDPTGHSPHGPHASGMAPTDDRRESDAGPTIAAGGRAVQLHNRYIVAETRQGVAIIDQHALHERILYERLRKRLDEGAVEMQNLLVPEPVDLPADEVGIVLDNAELLLSLGLKVEPFGGNTVLVAGYPVMLEKESPGAILREVAAMLVDGRKTLERRDLVEHILQTIACKAAIKAGDPLRPSEIESLLAQREGVEDTHHCPHGRPSELIFTRAELDKQFRRV